MCSGWRRLQSLRNPGRAISSDHQLVRFRVVKYLFRGIVPPDSAPEPISDIPQSTYGVCVIPTFDIRVRVLSTLDAIEEIPEVRLMLNGAIAILGAGLCSVIESEEPLVLIPHVGPHLRRSGLSKPDVLGGQAITGAVYEQSAFCSVELSPAAAIPGSPGIAVRAEAAVV